jgi:hypothetical protein
MPTDSVKILVVERNGVELQFHEEFELLAHNIPFDEPGFDADNVGDAVIETGDAVAVLTVPIPLINNGTMSANTFIGYSNLLPGDSTPIVSPLTGSFSGFTWSNSKTDCDFALEFRLDTTTATPFFTWSVDNTQTAEVDLVTPEMVTGGQKFFIKYIDEGTNAQDVAIILKFRK